MTNYVSVIADLLENTNPVQSKKVKLFLNTCNEEYYKRANTFFTAYERLLKYLEKDFKYTVNCYNQMIAEMLYERISFLNTGRYSNSSFADVNNRLYSQPEAFEHHMHGLALAQFLWWDQYQRFSFFADNLHKYAGNCKSYLEIGGGHGLYTSEALRQLRPDTIFDIVDISPTSIEMSKVALNTYRVNFFQEDVLNFSNEIKYDFICIGEVIEHVEDPLSLMRKLRSLLTPNGIIFVTTPANAPMIDHIYLFNDAVAIRALLAEAGFKIIDERAVYAENMDEKKAMKHKAPLMFAAFIQNRDTV